MSTHIGKWGNSLAVRLPTALVAQFGLREDSLVDLIADERGILVRKPSYPLEELLAGIRPENLPRETSLGSGASGEVE